MSDPESAEYLARDWICKNPTEDEIRFDDDSDFISSDDSDIEKSNFSKLKKYNQLLPRAKSIHKLLRSTKPAFNKSWRADYSTFDLLNKYNEDKTGFIHNSKFYTSDDSDSDEDHYSIGLVEENSKTVDKSLNSARRKGNDETWKTVNNKVDLQEEDTESESETALSETMAKSQKRKREPSASGEEEASSVKNIKTKKKREKTIWKKVKVNENGHNVSATESEDSERNSSKIQSKRHTGVHKANRNLMNTHLLSSESDNEADLSVDLTSSNVTSKKAASENGEVSDNELESYEISEEEISHVENTVKITSNTSVSRKKLHRTPEFTRELNEEISNFSLLLDEKLIEKNDIWILQCPSNMDCSELVSQRLSLGGCSQLDDGERTYDTYSYQNTHTRSATLAVPSELNRLHLRRIPISGNIIVEESVKSINVRPNEVILEPPSRVEFPGNLRVRHPLLGIDYSKQPRTAERKPQSVPKQKKHSKKHGESYNGSAEQLLEESANHSAVKKKKKKKHKDKDSFN